MSPSSTRAPRLLDGFTFPTQCMLREFARVEAFEKVSPLDLLPLRALDADAQSRVLGKMWERLYSRKPEDKGWFARELLAEVSGGESRFNPDTIKLLNSVLVLSKPGLQQALQPMADKTALQVLDASLLQQLASMDHHQQIICLQHALVTTEGTPLETLIMMLSSGALTIEQNSMKETTPTNQTRMNRKTSKGSQNRRRKTDRRSVSSTTKVSPMFYTKNLNPTSKTCHM